MRGGEHAELGVLAITRLAAQMDRGVVVARGHRQGAHAALGEQRMEARQRCGVGEVALVFLARHRQGDDEFDAQRQRFLGHQLVAAFGQRRDHAQWQLRVVRLQAAQEGAHLGPEEGLLLGDQVAMRRQPDAQPQPRTLNGAGSFTRRVCAHGGMMPQLSAGLDSRQIGAGPVYAGSPVCRRQSAA